MEHPSKDDSLVYTIEVGRVRARVWRHERTGDTPTLFVRISCVAGAVEIADLTRDDLLLAARSLDLAHAFICQVERAHDGVL